MIIPVRCFSCGRIIGNKWEEFQSLLATDVEPGEALDKIGFTRFCCRRMFLTHVDLSEHLLVYSVQKDRTATPVQPTAPAPTDPSPLTDVMEKMKL
mmetsp:Transcript_11601/g.16104  ORF Transcript_11601/g.16104 Transcript_11601/m.16104 type:complete len:96 (-) Transcript_11601:34-321(-)